MLNMTDVVTSAARRGHDLVCPDTSTCTGPSNEELMVAAAIVSAALPSIFADLTRDAVSVSTAMSQGKFLPGPPDATQEGAEELLRRWFHLWRTGDAMPLPGGLHVKTVAFLTVQAVAAGKTVRSPADV